MKRILLIGGFAVLCYATGSAQSNQPAQLLKGSSPKTTTTQTVVTPAPTMTQEEKNAKALADTPQGQNNVRLGLPVTATKEEYAAAKEKLFHENPQKYQELFGTKTGAPEVIQLKRSEFNKMNPQQQARVQANPERFNIVD